MADDEPDVHEYYRTILPAPGQLVATVTETGWVLVAQCLERCSCLVIVEITGMDGLDASAELDRDGPIPAILVSAHHDAEFTRRAEADRILSYPAKPIEQSAIGPAIAVALRRFEQFQVLRN